MTYSCLQLSIFICQDLPGLCRVDIHIHVICCKLNVDMKGTTTEESLRSLRVSQISAISIGMWNYFSFTILAPGEAVIEVSTWPSHHVIALPTQMKDSKWVFWQLPSVSTSIISSETEELNTVNPWAPHEPGLHLLLGQNICHYSTREASMRLQVLDCQYQVRSWAQQFSKCLGITLFPVFSYLTYVVDPLGKNWKESLMYPFAVVVQSSILMGTQPLLKSICYGSENWLSSGNYARDCDALLGSVPSPS